MRYRRGLLKRFHLKSRRCFLNVILINAFAVVRRSSGIFKSRRLMVNAAGIRLIARAVSLSAVFDGESYIVLRLLGSRRAEINGSDEERDKYHRHSLLPFLRTSLPCHQSGSAFEKSQISNRGRHHEKL